MNDDDNHGVAPQFQGLMSAILNAENLPMQIVHLSRRSGWGTICGSASGQVSRMPVGITCPECRKSKRVRK